MFPIIMDLAGLPDLRLNARSKCGIFGTLVTKGLGILVVRC